MTRKPFSEFDVAVLGGGPAGAAAATLLARWGHAVVVLTRPSKAAGGLAESLPPSTVKLLERVGASEAVDAAGFVRSSGNTVWWGRGEGRTERFPAGSLGYQVARARLDALLLGVAEQAGAQVQRDVSVRSVELGSEPILVHVDQGRGAPVPVDRVRGPDAVPDPPAPSVMGSVRARWVLDCTGRTGVVARRGFRCHEDAPATVALVAAWRRPAGWPVDEPTHTLVESYTDGWAWSVPLSTELRFFTVMVDPRHTGLLASKDLEPMYRAELAKTEQLSGLMADARLVDPPWGCTASLYSASRYADQGLLLVGDAGSFLDPITSFGVKKALASGWRAAVVCHSALDDSRITDAGLELFDTRERLVHASYLEQSAAVFADAGADHAHPFWTARARGASAPVDVDGDLDVEQLREDRSVLAAFERLRGSDSIALAVGSGVGFLERPTIEGNQVVMEERVATPEMPSGVRFLRGVDLVEIVRRAGDHDQVPDLFEAYCEAVGPVGLPDFLGALSVMLARGILENGA